METENYHTVGTTSLDISVGIVCHYQFENGSSQFAFMDVESERGASLDHSLSFSTENFVQTLAFCNGLILLSGFSGDQSCYHVFNPLTKHNVMIPQTSTQGGVVRVGLAYDGDQFEVVLVEAGSSNSNGLKLHVFSSDTGQWRCHYPTNITSAPSLQELEFQELGTPPLYANSAIHWEICGYLLVYQVQGSHCALYELPNYFDDWSWQSTLSYRRSLCESGGEVYYCYTDFDGFHIWKLLNEEEHPGFFNYCDYKRFPWKLVHSVMHQVLMPKHQNFFGSSFVWEPYKVAPIAYSEQAQIIYLQLPGIVVAYNFDTGTMGSVCTYSYPGINFNCCSFFSSTASGPHHAQRDSTNGQSELNLPIAEMEKLTL
ncbi:hypothetical protein AAZX31_18G045100 [Glycine max]|uniref:F-box protein At3g26010-like beta-propeller domain-containing protein n=1 Tax=Glycine max TaxID=3847 RepID=I1MZI8_SOYBN|nr:uncharacterized protein LOC102663613 [Glycine max]XP_006602033.1 uncharacterized protein LOC102663613 [Glycine max]KAG4923476.1 hypothetical protein JHK87_049016 [Glycine soja]KAG4935063.1 hypothetical protein JHK85_049982 [Glycine max]KAG5090584.1 hypothetical protein JHK82_049362 [Glycine max]KAH1153182.1 hypothetical protein GYH30_049020 [Glycine max]KAH1196805.1 hypothetical protein GmHk_18G050740 [Glycine max]|eukprot:XP_006602032.1 uncharacterized protein LOC102663613 [Glycine max]